VQAEIHTIYSTVDELFNLSIDQESIVALKRDSSKAPNKVSTKILLVL